MPCPVCPSFARSPGQGGSGGEPWARGYCAWWWLGLGPEWTPRPTCVARGGLHTCARRPVVQGGLLVGCGWGRGGWPACVWKEGTASVGAVVLPRPASWTELKWLGTTTPDQPPPFVHTHTFYLRRGVALHWPGWMVGLSCPLLGLLSECSVLWEARWCRACGDHAHAHACHAMRCTRMACMIKGRDRSAPCTDTRVDTSAMPWTRRSASVQHSPPGSGTGARPGLSQVT